MQPRFRNDLTSAREEQQGVVFYRIDDPETQTSFRLYEIEYLIAKKLDGQRAIQDVIGAVKEEYNFDISEPDLKKFVSQLESMGFISDGDAGAAVPLLDDDGTTTVDTAASSSGPPPPPPGASDFQVTTETATVTHIEAPAFEANTGEATVPDRAQFDDATEIDPTEELATPNPPAEHERLLESAVDYINQGYLVHARDYFLAAADTGIADTRVERMVAELEAAGDEPSDEEVSRLRALSASLFDGTSGDPSTSDGGADGDDGIRASLAEARRAGSEEDLRARVVWTLILVFVLVGGGIASWWGIREARVFEAAVQVKVVELQSAKIPIFHEEPALSIGPVREGWLKLAGSGKVGRTAKAGTRVAKDEIVLTLAVGGKAQKVLDKTEAAFKTSKAQFAKLAAKAAKLEQQREDVQATRDDAQTRLQQLRSEGGPYRGRTSRQEVQKLTKAKARANKKLTQMARNVRKMVAQRKKSESRLRAAESKLAAVHQRMAGKFVRAPYAGIIVEVRLGQGDSGAAGDKAILVRDNLTARVKFSIAGPTALLQGGEAMISVDNGHPAKATAVSVVKAAAGGATVLEVDLPDGGGLYSEMQASSFRLMREVADPAFSIDSTAVVVGTGAPGATDAYVMVVRQGRGTRRGVDILDRNADKTVVRAESEIRGGIRGGDKIVVSTQTGATSALPDDIEVLIEE